MKAEGDTRSSLGKAQRDCEKVSPSLRLATSIVVFMLFTVFDTRFVGIVLVLVMLTVVPLVLFGYYWRGSLLCAGAYHERFDGGSHLRAGTPGLNFFGNFKIGY
jgi:hypothetical protein